MATDRARAMTNPQDLTGRDLDAAVATALGWTSLRIETLPVYRRGITGGGGFAPTADSLVGNPPDGSSPPPLIRHVPQFSEDGDRIPELFAEIRKRREHCRVTMHACAHPAPDCNFLATTEGAAVFGTTPNEALARLLLMVASREP